MEFLVLLCGDILVEVLRYGNRYKLVQLEKVGRRLHLIVEGFFENTPFIRLTLQINPEIRDTFVCKQGISIIGNQQTNISPNELAEFPSFLRFGEVRLCYQDKNNSIGQRCELINGHLQLLEPALRDTGLVFLKDLVVADDRYTFRTHAQLLAYVGIQLLSICDSSHGYKFYIVLHDDQDSAPTIISSLLMMPPIYASSIFKIHICPGRVTSLPVECISYWLNQSPKETEILGAVPIQRFLKISMNEIQNIKAMCDHLHEVFPL